MPAEEDRVDILFEGVYLHQEDKGFARWQLEGWPASIELEVPAIGSDLRSWLGIAFSSSSTPQTHESFRLGLAFDTDEPEPRFPTRENLHRDDRIYLYGRFEPEWLPEPAVLRLMYPLSESMNGQEWYWRAELSNLQFDVAKKASWRLAVIGELAYSPDPEVGFHHDFGLLLGKGGGFFAVTQDTISVGWSGTVSRR